MKKDENKLILAWKLLDCGQYEKSLLIYVALPWSEEKYNGLARAWTELNRFEEAERVLEKGLKEYPKSCPLLLGMGNLYLKRGDNLAALRCFERILKLSANDHLALYGKAAVLRNLGQINEAIAILTVLIDGNPEDPLYITEKAHCLLEMGCYHDALELYRKAMNIWRKGGTFQDGVALYSGLCSAYIELQMKKEALEVALDGLKIFSAGHPTLYFNAGVCLSNIGLASEAMELLKGGLKKFPHDEELKELLKELEEDDSNPPDGGGKKPILGLVLLALLIRNRLKKK
jgi:tetratricopeptide (TPR) repeat protein